jgi:hypothetical protein
MVKDVFRRDGEPAMRFTNELARDEPEGHLVLALPVHARLLKLGRRRAT